MPNNTLQAIRDALAIIRNARYDADAFARKWLDHAEYYLCKQAEIAAKSASTVALRGNR